MPPATSDYERLRTGAAGIDLREWSLLELTGDDRLEWLQGQATGDVRGLTPGNRRSFCLCEPTGQILAVLDAWALPDRIVMTTSRELAKAVLARVERMTIMEDVVAAERGWEGVSVQGPEAAQKLEGRLDLPEGDAGTTVWEGREVWLLRSNRAPHGGWDVWSPAGTGLAERFPTIAFEAYEAARIVAGVPRWGVDMGPRTLPPELGPDFEARHVSYDKGCYTGQEVLMRMHSRGHTNKTWIGLVADSPLPVGAEVVHEGKPAGLVSSAAGPTELGFVGAATLRNEATQPGTCVLVGGVEAEVRRMPLSA